ncbi:hypothetical protein MOQ72_37385 [Saccharopolyspora sp. K220]|uniref:hypothetical protein n=1 Tax=Saccharopolyspora soli TaxID=2926618 RepID=UPI001F569C0E|nr:hypothetical protein [Saccharopolyspora soli]MCI2423107.1 hypothetical protein [Saccharopolyspora soli]
MSTTLWSVRLPESADLVPVPSKTGGELFAAEVNQGGEFDPEQPPAVVVEWPYGVELHHELLLVERWPEQYWDTPAPVDGAQT